MTYFIMLKSPDSLPAIQKWWELIGLMETYWAFYFLDSRSRYSSKIPTCYILYILERFWFDPAMTICLIVSLLKTWEYWQEIKSECSSSGRTSSKFYLFYNLVRIWFDLDKSVCLIVFGKHYSTRWEPQRRNKKRM